MNLIETALAELLSEADLKRGFKDVEVELQDGSKPTVRVSAIAPELRDNLLMRYAYSQDGRVVVLPMLDKQFANDAFLDSLRPSSLARLANTAVAILLGGTEALRNLIETGGEDFKRDSAASN